MSVSVSVSVLIESIWYLHLVYWESFDGNTMIMANFKYSEVMGRAQLWGDYKLNIGHAVNLVVKLVPMSAPYGFQTSYRLLKVSLVVNTDLQNIVSSILLIF